MQANQSLNDRETRILALNKRLEEVGWGLFLMMIGVIWLLPDAQVPQGIWLIGAALILLGLNGVRFLNRIKMSGFTITLGLLALAGGLGAFMGVKLPLFAILLVLIGAGIILRPLLSKRS